MGCIGIKAYHFAKGDERTQPPALDKLWIDIGAKDKADAERMGIQVGTPVTLYNPPHCLGNDLVCSKALDDRLGCTALLGVAEAIASTPLDIAVFLVASVQEEFNIRGIIPFYDACAPTWRLVLISPPPATRLTCRITRMCGSTTASASPV